MRLRVPAPRPWLLAVLLPAALAGCASLAPGRAGAPAGGPRAGVPPASAAASPAAGAASVAPGAGAAATPRFGPAPGAGPAGGPPPFDTVVKDATRSDGLLAFWRKDERLWVELRPEDLGRAFFLSPKLATGVGEPPAWGGQMLDGGPGTGPQIVEFRRQYNQVQLIARNQEAIAPPDTPEARALDAAYPPSLLGSAPVASQPHPKTKAVLVDVTGLFVSDMLGVGTLLQRGFRQGYSLDARNSAVTGLRNTPSLSVIEVRNHYATAALAEAPRGAAAGGPAPRAPRFVPDPRSLFIGLHYSISPLPSLPMPGRRADPRVGYFDTAVRDLGDDRARDPRQRWIARWRLEKQEPDAALSHPVRPITFWLDRSIPLRYRDTVRDAVLAWNRAFERIGFRDAIVVRQQPDDADFDTLDTDHASVRWLADASAGFNAIGPSHVDPRSGEILDADIAIQGVGLRGQRSLGRQLEEPDAALDDPAQRFDPRRCEAGAHAGEQLGYAAVVAQALSDAAEGIGGIGDDRDAEHFTRQYLRWVVMHEVGHALGLRHNFRGTASIGTRALDDPAFVRENGTSASVMDYPAVDLRLGGRPAEVAFPQQLGAYDLWAIEYGYAPIDGDAPARAEALRAIAARGQAEPQLAYATDEDVQIGLDPDAMAFDLGDDAIAFAERRFEVARAVLRRQQTRPLPPDEDYASLRRAISYAVRDAGRAASIAARQIGGLYTRRDFPGSGRDPLQPVPAARQRAALDLIAREALAADSLPVPPALRRRLAPDFFERGDALWNGGSVGTDYSVDRVVFDTQRGVLGTLMSDAVASRVLDNGAKLDDPRDALTLAELYERITREVWSELGQGGEIPAARRELQREHANRLGALLLQPSALSRADARSLARVEARALLARLDRALARRQPAEALTRAHLADAAESLRLALSAPLLRGSP